MGLALHPLRAYRLFSIRIASAVPSFTHCLSASLSLRNGLRGNPLYPNSIRSDQVTKDEVDGSEELDDVQTPPSLVITDEGPTEDDMAESSNKPKSKRVKSNRRHLSTKGVVDEGFPKPCPDSATCGITKSFANKKNLDGHRNSYHDENWPDSPCNVPFCLLPQTHLVVSRMEFNRHLRDEHHLKDDDALKYIGKIVPLKEKAPRGTGETFAPTTCQVKACTSETEHQDYRSYTTHLRKVHKFTAKDFQAYMPAKATDSTG